MAANTLSNVSQHYLPIPKDTSEFHKEVAKTGLSPSKTTNLTKRESVLKCVYDTKHLDRSCCQAFIMVVGCTGAGKSSSINHLFDLKGDNQLRSETCYQESQTKSAQEYILECDDEKYAIKNASLSIIDTPGFNDTDGLAQDACNLRAIKRFCKEHPHLKGKKPNLIFLCFNGNENRFKGPQSKLSKSLRSLKNLDVVDTNHPNIVGIITHACSVIPRQLEEKQLALRDMIESTFGFSHAPVILLENEFNEYKLERPYSVLDETPSDFTLLPNGDLQPQNLFLACNSTLQASNDSLGEIILQACFMSGNDNLRGKMGFEIRAKIHSEEQPLDEEENKILSWLKSLENANKNDLLAEKFTSLENYSADRSRPEERMSFLNKGFDIITEKENPEEIFQLEYVDAGLGLLVPSCSHFEKLNETRDVMELFESKESFVNRRLNDFNVKIDIDFRLLNFRTGSGFNEETGFKNGKESKSFSFLREFRSSKLTIKDKSSLHLTKNFKDCIEALPDMFDSRDEGCKRIFKSFFDRWGQFVITSVYVGGSLTGHVTSHSSEMESFEKIRSKLHTGLGLPFVDLGFSWEKEYENILSSQLKISLSQLQWRGGSHELHSDKSLFDKNEYQKWHASLIEKPVILTKEMNLTPISEIIGNICKKRELAATLALEHQHQLRLKIIKEREAEMQAKERAQLEALTRKKTVEQHSRNHQDGGCFSFLGNVWLLDCEGMVKSSALKDIQIGDRILSWNTSKKRCDFSEVICFADYEENLKTKFLQINLDSAGGSALVLTPNHLMMIGSDRNATAAMNVKVGDQVMIVKLDNSDYRLQSARVESIQNVIENGCVAPVTMLGNLFVDNVLASCYANVKSVKLFNRFCVSGQNMAHKAFAPLRLYHRLLNSVKKEKCLKKQMHPYVTWLMSLKLSKKGKYSFLF